MWGWRSSHGAGRINVCAVYTLSVVSELGSHTSDMADSVIMRRATSMRVPNLFFRKRLPP